LIFAFSRLSRGQRLCRRLAELDGPMRVEMSEHRLASRMRHDGCGGRTGRVELLTGIDGVSSRRVRKIVLREGR
jgi:hypothetical protein